jgi:transcriptional regulator with XRE-family HTH domain
MGETRQQREDRERRHRIAEQQDAARRAIGEELRRARQDANVSLRALGRASSLDPSHLARAEAGRHALSHDALVAAGTALGRDVSIRLFESAAVPHVRDRLQVQMIEALLAALHPRWDARLEVAVYRPVRGVIDLVLHDRDTLDLVAGEAHSLLHTVEGQLRWAGQKADALASAAGWPWADASEPPRIGRLLLLRSCSAMHDLVRTAPRTFTAAYPGDTELAVATLMGPAGRWPGAAVAWVTVDGKDTRLLTGPPRALRR